MVPDYHGTSSQASRGDESSSRYGKINGWGVYQTPIPGILARLHESYCQSQSGGYACLSTLVAGRPSFHFSQFFNLRQNMQSDSLGWQTHSREESLIVSMIGSQGADYIQLRAERSENEKRQLMVSGPFNRCSAGLMVGTSRQLCSKDDIRRLLPRMKLLSFQTRI